MKKTLLFAFIAFSINAFSQLNPIRPFPQDPKSTVIHTTPVRPETGFNPTKTNPVKEHANDILRSTRELFNDIQVLDSIYFWVWDTLGNKWELSTKAINILYNGDGYPTSITYQNLDGGIWVNSFQFNITYDANNNELSQTYRAWNGIAFVNVFQDVFTYDANGNQTSDIFQLWSGTAWVNSNRYLYTYDASNNLTSSTEQDWNGTSFDNYSLYTYTYDANGNRLSETAQIWNDVDLIWENTNRTLYTYDANNNQLTAKYQYWNTITVDWEDSGLYTNTYDANNNPINQLYQYWDGTQWVNYSNYISTYNASNDLTNTLTQVWNVTNWENSARATYTYDGNHQLTRLLNETWNGSWIASTLSFNTYGEGGFLESYSNRTFDAEGDIVTDGDSTFNFFHTISAIHETTGDDGDLSVYPNPGTGKFTISSKDVLKSLRVYTMVGELVYTNEEARNQISAEIDLTSLGKGMYIMTAGDGKKMYNRKVLVQ